ncbi:MAG TPA: DUF2892 domain-containing protein [Rhodocyclaceae bacterium]|nr:DUF2892 domain-containing protein [Rhodocyclaceae bacterium]
MKIKTNVGGIDRVLRISSGATLIFLALLDMLPWGWIGIAPLLSGLFAFCPFYNMTKASTHKTVY